MAGGLALSGLVALAFGIGSYYATGAFGAFGVANAAGGALALAAAALVGLRRWRGFGSRDARRVLAAPLLGLLAALAGTVALERLADARAWRLDLTFERRYALADSTRALVAALPDPVHATLFCEQGDPRCRSTRILLETLADAGRGRLAWTREDLADDPESADRFGIATSNTVVVERGGRFAKVERPSEGSLYEAMQRLVAAPAGFVYVARGEGEGDPGRTDEVGYSGLASALETEGYRLRDLVLAATDEMPADAAALLLLAPERELRPDASAALGRWLADGRGRLVVCLEPGRHSGIEPLLARWGLHVPDRLVVDPASGPLAGDPPGVNPIVHQFADHPVTGGLGATRMVFFRGARPVIPAQKPRPDDDLRAVVFSSRRAWLADAASVDGVRPPRRPAEAAEDYQPLVAIGRYARDLGETRIVAFGDCDFAANRNLRALYNQDLALNAVHWAADRTERITLRPKALPPYQFPLTPQETLRMLYGIGLLVPELLLLGAGLAWLRRRAG